MIKLYKTSEQRLLVDCQAEYEEIAVNEEIYLEENEEELRTTLTSGALNPTHDSICMPVDIAVSRVSLREERSEAAKDLITGDCDDAPLSEAIIQRTVEDPA